MDGKALVPIAGFFSGDGRKRRFSGEIGSKLIELIVVAKIAKRLFRNFPGSGIVAAILTTWGF